MTTDKFPNFGYKPYLLKMRRLQRSLLFDLEGSPSAEKTDQKLLVAERTQKTVQMLVVNQSSSRERLRLLETSIEYGRDAILIIDLREPDDRIIYASQKFEKLTGYKADALIGGNWRLLFQGDSDEGSRLLLQEAVAASAECHVLLRNVLENGALVLSEATFYPLIDENGSVTHYTCVILDESDKREAHQALMQAQKLDSLGILAGGIAHDFNNILQGVLIETFKAMEGLDEDDPIRKNVENAYQAGLQASSLANQLLTYTGQCQSESKLIDVNEVVRSTVQLIASTLTSEIALKVNLSELSFHVESQGSQIQQILVNLILNAAESISGKGQIEVSSRIYQPGSSFTNGAIVQNKAALQRLDPEKDYVLLQVEDTGCGMEDALIRKIFEPFFTTKAEGHGIGLSAALGAVYSQKGEVYVESLLGKGSKFSVFLPFVEVVDSKENTNTINSVSPVSNYSDDKIFGEPTVLIVDDDANIREVLEYTLQYMGCKTISADHGSSAIEIYKDNWGDIDLVFLDFNMPGMNGEEVFCQLSGLNPAIRCLFSSGSGPEIAKKTLKNEFNRIEFLQKPFELDVLRDVINRILVSG